MSEEAKRVLIDFERRADAHVDALSVAKLPARAPLTYFHTAIFHGLHVEGPRAPKVWQAADTTTYRLSYLTPWLRARAAEPIGEGPIDALTAVREADPDGRQITDLHGYAYFCEVMPDVHRGKLDVDQTDEGFRLVHPNADLETAEATDIIMSELALNFLEPRGPRLPEEEVFTLARTAPVLDEELLYRLFERFRGRFRRNVREEPLVGDRALLRIFGFNRLGFRETQASIFAAMEVFNQLALVLWIWAADDTGEPSEEALEWVSICWTYEGFITKLVGLTGLPRVQLESFVEHFTLDYNLPADMTRGGEGFTPPFVRLGDSILYSPDLVIRYCHPRNALYHLIRADPASW